MSTSDQHSASAACDRAQVAPRGCDAELFLELCIMRYDLMPGHQAGNWTTPCHSDKRSGKREPSAGQAMIPASIMLRCIANCLETSRYYVSKGNRPVRRLVA
jgi:hypothetical protein